MTVGATAGRPSAPDRPSDPPFVATPLTDPQCRAHCVPITMGTGGHQAVVAVSQ